MDGYYQHKNPMDFAFVARSECQTIMDYLPLLRHQKIENETTDGYVYEEFTDKLEKCSHNSTLLEILGDEINHCMLALFEIAKQLHIKIPTDKFPKDLPFKEE